MKFLSTFATTLVILTICQQPLPTSCARILGIFPVPSKSHLVVFSALTKELARRGHELVVVSPFPLSKPVANYTDINIMPSLKTFYDEIINLELYGFADMPHYQIPFLYWFKATKVMTLTFSDPGVLGLLEDKRGFDLIICEDFMTEALFAFADYFKAPLIQISSLGGFAWTNSYVGNPLEATYVPNPMLSFTDHMTIWERLENIVFTSFWDLGNLVYYIPYQESLRRSVFGDKTRSVWDLRYTGSLVLLNNHFSLNYPRPLVPAIQEVGGMHVSRTTNKLPKDIQDFLDGAKEGAIYFSMGSNLRSDLMPEERRAAFLSAFSEIPQRVLWKWESETLPGQPANVMLGKWLPQQDILAHPNVKVFITHGGLLSAQEAVYHGVPLVGIPVFGDQTLNMNKAVLGGYGVMVALKNVTKESVTWALNKALHDPSIITEAKRRSAVYRDQPEPPLDRAVFWTEYVLRHKGASHLRCASLSLSWYQHCLLDVLAVLLVLLLLLIWVIRCTVSYCCKTTAAPRTKYSKAKKKQ